MSKAYMGVRLRRLREERGITQAALAGSLGISTSYLSQIEQNQRPLTVPVLLRLNAAFGIDVQLFSEDEEGRLITDLREALRENPVAGGIANTELHELAQGMPAVARAIVSLHRQHREVLDRAEAMAARLGDDWTGEAPARVPFEHVRDFFYARRNHVPELDTAAERIYADAGLAPHAAHAGLVRRLEQRQLPCNPSRSRAC